MGALFSVKSTLTYLYSAMMAGTYSNGVEENVVGEGNKKKGMTFK